MVYRLTCRTVGQKIAAARAVHHIPQYKLSAAVDMVPRRLADIERGRVAPSPELADRIMRAIKELARD